jgi:hypothetical protein
LGKFYILRKGDTHMLTKFKGVLVGVAPVVTSLMLSAPVMAAGALETEVDTLSLGDGISAVVAAFGIIAAGLTVIWGVRKLIKIWNRS